MILWSLGALLLLLLIVIGWLGWLKWRSRTRRPTGGKSPTDDIYPMW